MAGGLLTSRLAPTQAAEYNSALTAAMHIGAAAQGQYEKQKYEAEQNDLANKAAVALQAQKDAADAARAKANNIASAAKEALGQAASLYKDKRSTLAEALKNPLGNREAAENAATEMQLLDNNFARTIDSYQRASGTAIDTKALGIDQVAPYSQMLTPNQNYFDAKRGKENQDIAKGKEEGLKATGEQKIFDKYGLPTVTQAIEYQTGQPLSLIAQNQSQQFRLSTGGLFGGAKQPAAIQNRYDKLRLETPGAISGMLSSQSALENSRQRLLNSGKNYFMPDGFTLKPSFRSGSDPNVKDYLNTSSAYRKLASSAASTYGENTQRVATIYPEFQEYLNMVSSEPGGLINPYDIKDAPFVSGTIDRLITKHIESGDMESASKWTTIKGELGLNAFGNNAPKRTFLTPPAEVEGPVTNSGNAGQ